MTLENDLIVNLERMNKFRMCVYTIRNGLFIILELTNKFRMYVYDTRKRFLELMNKF